MRSGIDRRDRHTNLVHTSVVHLQYHCNAGQRIIDAAADAEFLIAAFPTLGRCGKENTRNNLVGRKVQAHDAIVDIELRQRHATNAVRSCHLELRSETQQRWRRVAGECRPAELSARRDVAKIAVLLETEAATLAPQQRLVVPETT